ncbi:MAG: (Fe-S)-binding protein [Nitrososphaerota archaeon]
MAGQSFQLSTAQSLLDANAEVQRCVHCGYCLEHCPTRDAGVFDVYGARGKMILFKEILEAGRFELLDKIFGDRVLNCALCNWCTSKCPESIPLTDIFVLARYEAAKRGAVPRSVKKVADYILRRGNPFGSLSHERVEWADGLNLSNRGETVFFASCMGSTMGYLELLDNTGISLETIIKMFDLFEKIRLDKPLRYLVWKILRPNRAYNSTLRKCVSILRSLGIEPAYLSREEPCCGKPLHTYGLLDEFKQHAGRVANLLRARGVRRIIVNNPICMYTFKRLYPAFLGNFDVDVKHMVEVMLDGQAKVRRSGGEGRGLKIVYHDPCYMARYLSLVDEPRRLLESLGGAVLVEPERSKEKTYCSGDGGLEVTHPGAAHKVAMKRAAMLAETGADIVATSCPACIATLRIGLRRSGRRRGPAVVDVIDLL